MTPNKNSQTLANKKNTSQNNTPVSTHKSLKSSHKPSTSYLKTNFSQVSSRLYQNTKSVDNKRNLKFNSKSNHSEVHTPTKSSKKEFFISRPKKPLIGPDNHESEQCNAGRQARTPVKNSQRYIPSNNRNGTKLLAEDLMFHQNSSKIQNSGMKDKVLIRKVSTNVDTKRPKVRSDSNSKFPEERFMKSNLMEKKNFTNQETNLPGDLGTVSVKKVRKAGKENFNQDSLQNRRRQKKNVQDIPTNFSQNESRSRVSKILSADQTKDLRLVDSDEKNFFRN
jgi:hypothetical protein